MTSTHPAPELLLPYALGAHDAATAQHVEACPMCQSEIEHWQETAGLLRGPAVLERRTETPDCLDELVVADFVDGRLGPDTRGPVVAHLLSCARCRSVVKATSRLSAEMTVMDQTPARRWRRWSIPLGLAAAAALVFLLLPRGGDDGSSPNLREPTDTRNQAAAAQGPIHAPLPIAPRGPVARVDELLWASVTGVERYRVRLYNDDGDVLWTTETADTLVSLPDSVGLSPLATYFWKVEAQTEWKRWVSSDLVEFRLVGPSR
jgi:anti-sigma factor RsiW